MKFCFECGAKLTPKSKICPNCGQSLAVGINTVNSGEVLDSQSNEEIIKKLTLLNDPAEWNLAGIKAKNEANFELAESMYQRSIQMGDLAAKANLGILYKIQGRLEDAEKIQYECIEEGYTDSYTDLCILYRDIGIVVMQVWACAQIADTDADAANELFVIYWNRCDVENARQVLEQLDKNYWNANTQEFHNKISSVKGPLWSMDPEEIVSLHFSSEAMIGELNESRNWQKQEELWETRLRIAQNVPSERTGSGNLLRQTAVAIPFAGAVAMTGMFGSVIGSTVELFELAIRSGAIFLAMQIDADANLLVRNATASKLALALEELFFLRGDRVVENDFEKNVVQIIVDVFEEANDPKLPFYSRLL